MKWYSKRLIPQTLKTLLLSIFTQYHSPEALTAPISFLLLHKLKRYNLKFDWIWLVLVTLNVLEWINI